MFWQAVISISFLKLILWPCYFSTDFEVHRNWLAITHTLPLKNWYTENTSEWTLDYPPFFAWFEWALSQFARFVDPQMLVVSNLGHRTFETVFFQRVSVVVTDLVLAFGLRSCAEALSGKKGGSAGRQRSTSHWPLLVLTNAGLILVDHIHFQYNGFLFGILLASIGSMIAGNCLKSATYFVILLNLKHIFLYCAPAYFVYLFSSYCFVGGSESKNYYSVKNFSPANLVKLGAIVVTGFALSFGPFVAQGQLFNVLARLFPFKRGLTHAYWAPNFWAVYNAIDLAGSRIVSKFLNPNLVPAKTLTGGLVQETEHAILPNVLPLATFILTLLAQIPALVQLFRRPKDPLHFVRAVVLCSFASFLFGWHVHEKAILMVTVPLALLTTSSPGEAKNYFVLSTVATFSLFPLIFTPEEKLLKVLLLACQILVAHIILKQHNGREANWKLNWLEKSYLVGLAVVFFVEDGLRVCGLGTRFQFLPLLAISIYCSLPILASFVSLYKSIFRN